MMCYLKKNQYKFYQNDSESQFKYEHLIYEITMMCRIANVFHNHMYIALLTENKGLEPDGMLVDLNIDNALLLQIKARTALEDARKAYNQDIERYKHTDIYLLKIRNYILGWLNIYNNNLTVTARKPFKLSTTQPITDPKIKTFDPTEHTNPTIYEKLKTIKEKTTYYIYQLPTIKNIEPYFDQESLNNSKLKLLESINQNSNIPPEFRKPYNEPPE